MGANNSTCLPCKAAGASARRNKAATDVQNNRKISKEVEILKKVSTAAEPHIASGTPEQSSSLQGSPNNGSSNSSNSLQERAKTLQQKDSLPHYSHPEPSPPLAECSTVQQDKQQDELPSHEGQPCPQREMQLGFQLKGSTDVLPPHNKQLETVEDQKADERARRTPEKRIYVPSHMLAEGSEQAWKQHQGAPQALLSPHSCSVAHRVAAALRAAAGERAAAAAARAAEAAEAIKKMPRDSTGKPMNQPNGQVSGVSPAESKALTSAEACSAETLAEQQADAQQDAQRTRSRSSCFPHVLCFSSAYDSGNEINVRQEAEQQQEGENNSQSAEYSVISTAKRVGEMFSGAASAAVAFASSASGHSAFEAPRDQGVVSCGETSGRGQELWQTVGVGSEKAGELQDGAVVLLGAVDRAMDAITSDDFKKQASLLFYSGGHSKGAGWWLVVGYK
ncbi:hypothetical protein, conserved [Eimeria tenella]|uniref:Uncharacterized protein n=1 Tax=Eimeria tenella TaxID=5802 RepID=U6KHR4_EIMTE|nr:hypothetical protein, conserved [Eimeria tenella]CDJ37469.1 hypothetical protein, conserved [Eimeria tenella]|eukprot:XP_013228307.1 hypothetical protein, conserved [Eimeria tenella]